MLRRLLIAIAFLGASVVAFPTIAPDTAEAARPTKEYVCHWDDNDNVFDLIRIPTTQFEGKVNKKGKEQGPHGHGTHEDDVRMGTDRPADGCEGLEEPAE